MNDSVVRRDQFSRANRVDEANICHYDDYFLVTTSKLLIGDFSESLSRLSNYYRSRQIQYGYFPLLPDLHCHQLPPGCFLDSAICAIRIFKTSKLFCSRCSSVDVNLRFCICIGTTRKRATAGITPSSIATFPTLTKSILFSFKT